MMDNRFVRLTDCNGFQNMPGIMYWEKDNNSRYTSSNAYLSALFGLKNPEDILGRSDYEIPCAIAECADIFRKHDQLVMQNNKQMRFLEILHFIDCWRVMIKTKVPVFDSSCRVVGTQGYSIDVTGPFTNFGNLLLRNKSLLGENNAKHAAYIVGENNKISLSNRQSECLFLLLHGKSVKEIARLLKISPRTVENFIDQLKYRFGCRTRSELIASAIAQGFLNMIPAQFLNQQISIVLD